MPTGLTDRDPRTGSVQCFPADMRRAGEAAGDVDAHDG